MKNDDTKRQLAHYASVRFDEGDEWLENIVSELVGKLTVGEMVAVHMQDGSYRIGTVTGFSYSSPYNDRTMATIVSSITLGGGAAMKAADVVSVVGEFLAADESLRTLAAAAGGISKKEVGEVTNPAARDILAAIADGGGEWSVFATMLLSKVDIALARNEAGF